MTIIKSREVISEQNALIDKIDAFLEMRIKIEFDELREDIMKVMALNNQLIHRNAQLQAENDAFQRFFTEEMHPHPL